ncbi:MAG: aspartate dehydrogenase [Burkholderiales bacterium]|nr:aspartate dehydrogenase [Burkholderiales bacterium]
MFKLAIVGFGAIGQELAQVLQADGDLQIVQIVTTPQSTDRVRAVAARLASHALVLNELDVSPVHRPDLVVECAGHAAIVSHVVPALAAGIPCVVASVGALAEPGLFARLEDVAKRGHARVRLIPGAVGALDALAAARIGGLDRVLYCGRKPPRSWEGTPASQACDLSQLLAPCVVFEGSARDAAMAFPKNANVAATVALAGLGLDRTEVRLIADPGVDRNVHRLEAWGAFGHFEFQIENLALPGNPKTSALTVYSLACAVRNASAHVTF